MTPPIKFVVFVDDVKRGGRTEIDDDHRLFLPVFYNGGNAVDDTIRPHFSRVVAADIQSGFQAGLDAQRLYSEIEMTHALDRIIEGWYDRRDNPARNSVALNFPHL